MARQPDHDVGLNRRPTVGAAKSVDPYLPAHGNGGYRVEHYDLDIDYKLVANRIGGRAALTAVADAPLSRFSLDLTAFRVSKVHVDGRPARFKQSQSPRDAQKLHVTPARPVEGRFTVEVRYVGNPAPVSSRWGDVGCDLPHRGDHLGALHGRRHATVTTTQFVELACRHADTDLSPFFTAWLYRPQLPCIAPRNR